MKKFLVKLIAGTFLTLSVASPAYAASQAGAANIFDENIDFIMTFTPDEINSSIQDYYQNLVSEVIEPLSAEIVNSPRAGHRESALIEEFVEFLEDKLRDAPLAVAVNFEENGKLLHQPEPFILIEMSADEYTENIEQPYLQILQYRGEAVNSVKAGKKRIYTVEEGFLSMSHASGYLILAESTDSLINVFESDEDLLATDNVFKSIRDNIDPDNFFELYVSNFDAIYSELAMEFGPLFGPAFQSIVAEGISLAETNDGFRIKAYVAQDPTLLNDLGIDYSNLGSLSLYQHLDASDPIYFTDSLATSEVMKLLTGDPSFAFAVEEAAKEGIDLEALLDLLGDEAAFLADYRDELVPTMTYLARLGDNSEAAVLEFNKLSTLLWAEMITEADEQVNENTLRFFDNDVQTTVTKTTTTLGGAELDQWQFSLDIHTPQEFSDAAFPSINYSFNVTWGLVDDIFVFSNSNTLTEDWKGGINDLPSIGRLLDEGTDAVSYLSFDNLADYLYYLFEYIKEFQPSESDEISQVQQQVAEFFEPLHSIESTSEISNQHILSVIDLKVDTDEVVKAIAKWFDNGGLFGNSLGLNKFDSNDFNEFNDYEYDFAEEIFFEENLGEFSDVRSGDWYYGDVYYLYDEGILNGYEDGTFRPGAEVTRAEFIKVMMEVLASCGCIEIADTYGAEVRNKYSDLRKAAWYTPHLETAYQAGLLDRYTSKNFYPNHKINRLEAAKLLANVIDTYGLQGGYAEDVAAKFVDIQTWNTFREDVSKVNQLGLMNGVSKNQFGLYGKINRAEMAKIMATLLDASL
jgi:hypothetical protein